MKLISLETEQPSTHVPSARTTLRLFAPRTVPILAGTALVSIALNWLIAVVAVDAGASASFPPLTLPVFTAFTIVGVAAGWVGWRLIQRKAARPAKTLAITVPVFVLASFIPDMLVLWLKFIPDTTGMAVLALMAMHVIVALVAVPGYRYASRNGKPSVRGSAGHE